MITAELATPSPDRCSAGDRGTRRPPVFVLWAVLLVAVVIGSLLPAASPVMVRMGRLPVSQKTMHFVAYLVVSLLPVIGFRRRSRGIELAFSMFLVGVLLEAGQHFSPGRSPEWSDVIRNGLGVACGILLGIAARSRSGSPASFSPGGRANTTAAGVAESPCRRPPTASVIIPTRNRPELLERCLAAVMVQDYPRFEVLVVDSGPSDERSREVVERWGVRYAMDPAPGLSRARNLGASLCHSDVLAYLDDDAIPEPGWLSALVEEFADPKVIVAAGPVLPLRVETDAERLSAVTVEADPRLVQRRVVDSRTPGWVELACFGGIGNGGNMAFRRHAWSVWPGFDERMGRGAWVAGGEEHQAFFRLIDGGYRAVSTPKAIVRHPLPSTMEQMSAFALRDASSAAASFTLFLFEATGYRGRFVRYILEALAGKTRLWRGQPKVRIPRILSRWRILRAYLKGPLLYARARWAGPSPEIRPADDRELLVVVGPEPSLDAEIYPAE